MKNQQTQQSETAAGQSKKGNGGTRLPMAALVLGIIAIAFVLIWVMKFAASSSRPSTPSEIAAHKEFQEKLITAQNEYQQKVDKATKEAGERQMELHEKSNAAQEEFQQKLNAALQETEQKSDSIGK